MVYRKKQDTIDSRDLQRRHKFKKAVKLFLEGMNNTEIAKEMGVSGASVGCWMKTKDWEDELTLQTKTHPLYDRDVYLTEIDVINENFKKLVNTRFMSLARLEMLLADASKEVSERSKEIDAQTGKPKSLDVTLLVKKKGIPELVKSLESLGNGLVNYVEALYQVGSVAEYIRKKNNEDEIFNP